MAESHPTLSKISLRGRRRRYLADLLLRWRPRIGHPPRLRHPIKIVCISDTHNTQPDLPAGDVLIHAGDLTENGSFDEVQAGLKWLSSQAHRYKILVAGNHDVLLDESFLEKYPERRYGQAKTKQDLDWGDVTYLEDSGITLEFPDPDQTTHEARAACNTSRQLTLFGSPWTPRYGVSAFQYDPADCDHWPSRLGSLSPGPDVLITHGPPRLHLDRRDFHRAGCPYLAEEAAKLRPRLLVFGHIHAAYGREDVVLDNLQRGYEEVMVGWAGWMRLSWMAVLVVWIRVKTILERCGVLVAGRSKVTTFVNASVVAGARNRLSNEPIVVDI